MSDDVTEAMRVILRELTERASECDASALSQLLDLVKRSATRWFFTGQGRSALVARMSAMRFMQVGQEAFVVGEPTTPAVGAGDTLIAFSGSGRTRTTVWQATRAKELGAEVVVITTDPSSPLAALADLVVPIPRGDTRQPPGSPVEQLSLLVMEALVVTLSTVDDDLYAVIGARHANLE